MASEPVLPVANTPSPAPSSTQPVKASSFAARLKDDISISHADIPIVLCSMVSGLCDSVAFNASNVFVSMQTGNTVFLALGAAMLPRNIPLLWLKSLCSIAAFLLGVYSWSKVRYLHPKRKVTLAGSFLIQALFIWIAAALAQSSVVPSFGSLEVAESLQSGDQVDLRVLAPIMLMAFQFGGQIVTSRQLGFNEVPTNVLTSVYCDLFSDPNLFAPPSANPKRNRRAGAVVCMVIGAICGGWLSRSTAGMGTSLWIAGALKFGIAIAWTQWAGKEETAETSGEKAAAKQ